MSDNINFEYKNLSPFKWFVLENFPFIEADFDALTEWQLFCKLGKEINKIIDSQNIIGEQAEVLTTAFNNLKNYVDNYFNNLDVQEEINNKLNEMAEDGTLSSLMSVYIDNVVNPSLNNLQNQINSLASGSPLVASSISEMTDTSRVYVNTTDNHWYWYNGSTWIDGGIYQSSGIADGSITPIKTSFMEEYNLVPQDNYKENYYLNNNDGSEMSFSGACYSSRFISIPDNEEKIVIFSKNNGNCRIYFYDDTYTFISSIAGSINEINSIVSNAKYIRIGFQFANYRNDYKILFYDNFIDGINFYNKGSLKDDYINFDSSKILYNSKKLNLLPLNYDTEVASALINGNKAHFEFSYNNNSDKFIGFPINFLVKENDQINIEIIDKLNNFNTSDISVYNAQVDKFALGTNTGKTIYLTNKKGSIIIDSSMINNINNNTLWLTWKVPATSNEVNYNYDVKIQINDDSYYFDDLIKQYDTKKEYKAIFLGDSITALTGDRAWINYFNNILNITSYENVAVAGATLMDKENTGIYDGNPTSSDADNNVLGNQVQKIINNHLSYITPDFIIIAIGTNEGITFTNEQEIYDTYWNNDGTVKSLNSVNRKTSAGAFRYANEKLHELYPESMIVWCTPIQANTLMKNVSNTIQYGENLKKLCAYGSNYCIDTEKCGILGINEVPYQNGEDLLDGLHPNAHGAKKMGIFNACEFKKFLDL